MIDTVAILFAIAALGGLTAAAKHFRGNPVSPVFGFAHGAIASMGLLFLGITVFTIEVDPLVKAAFWLFLLTAAGGLFMASLRLRGKKAPKPVIVIHGMAAVVSFGLLLIGAYLR